MKATIKRLIVRTIPLRLRKVLAIWVNRQSWLEKGDRAYWATQLLTDFASEDVNAYHKFLWKHHLAYAETYEIGLRFGYENFNETRRMLFSELPRRFEEADLGTAADVRTVFEVGCSLGYLLRHMETVVFPNATRLEGIDIDAHAIEEGSRYLKQLGSAVKLHHGDMESMEEALGDSKFDLVLASGVLLYLDEDSAAGLVAKLLRRTGKLLAITALAHPVTDNARLAVSEQRASDGTWIHNVDRMIEAGGGRLVGRRWEGGKLVDGNTVYFLYAVPSRDGP